MPLQCVHPLSPTKNYDLISHRYASSIFTAGLNQTNLLILRLWLPTPFWCLIFSILLLLISFLLCLVDSLGVVLGGRVDGVEDL